MWRDIIEYIRKACHNNINSDDVLLGTASINFSLWSMKDLSYTYTECPGVPKKTHFSGVLAITLLWKVLGTEVGWFYKNSGNLISDRHKNFAIWPIWSWDN